MESSNTDSVFIQDRFPTVERSPSKVLSSVLAPVAIHTRFASDGPTFIHGRQGFSTRETCFADSAFFHRGEGRNAAEVISAGATYVGLDISRRMLGKARERIRNGSFKKVDLLVGDALLLPFRSSSFDKSMCFATVFFVPDQRGAIKQILRV